MSQNNKSSTFLGGKAVQSQYLDLPKQNESNRNEFYDDYLKKLQINSSPTQSPIQRQSKNFLGERISQKSPLKTINSNIHSKHFDYPGNLASPVPLKNNEDIKNYLQKIETLLGNNKTPVRSDKSSNYNDHEDVKSMISMGKSKHLVENEGLRYLEKKYLSNEIQQQLNHSTILVKTSKYANADPMIFEAHNYKLGEILCVNCQEFINPEEIDAHSITCLSHFKDQDIGYLNDKIENMKLLLIIDFKNFKATESNEEFCEFEHFLQIGTVIIDEIIFNNKNLDKLKENFEDLKELYYSMNRLRTKKMVNVKSLIERIIQSINEKIQIFENNKWPSKNNSPLFPNRPSSNNHNNLQPLSPQISPGRRPVPQKHTLMDYFDN